FGKGFLDNLSKGRSGFRDHVFPGVARVKGIEVYKLLNSQTDFNNLLNDDVVRVCLLLALDFVFIRFDLRHVISKEVLNLVDDFVAWDNFPWGQHIWAEFHNKVYNNDHTVRKGHLKKTATLSPTYLPTYTFQGFVFPLKVVRTEVSREIYVRTEVRRVVHVRIDVHHYVDEGLSLQDLVKIIGDMQQEFQSHITAIEQYVNQHKTSITANDSLVDNVFSDTSDFDHDSFSRFTKNSVDRAALINNITDMRVDFQRRITAIEEYLKISTSFNVEKTLVKSDIDNQNVDNHSIDFDHDPKTSFESDVDTKNVDNHSMDIDRNPKVLKQQNILEKNLFDEFEQQVSSNSFINHEELEEPIVIGNIFFQEEDQQFSLKNLDVQQEQMHNQLRNEPMMLEATVQGRNNVETAQSIITECKSQD
nr:phospholipase-like protein [Tanacetum cinerariifolium]